MGLFLPGDNRPCFVGDAELAEKLGVNIAIVLGRIIWSLEEKINANRTEFFKDGRWWMYDTIPALMAYSKLGRKQILLVLETLRKKKILITGQFDHKFAVRRNWYSIDKLELMTVISPIVPKGDDTPMVPKGDYQWCQKGTIHSAETEPLIVPKGDDTSLLLRGMTKNHTESQTESPTATITPLPIKTRKERKHKLLTFEPEDFEIGKAWLIYAEREMSWRKGSAKWTPEYFAEALRKVREKTNLNFDGMRAVLKFVDGHDFWASKCTSPSELLKITDKDSGRRKIDSILAQMKPNNLRQEEKMASWNEADFKDPFSFGGQ